MSKNKYDTIRDLEGQHLGLFKKAGITGLIGLVLTLFGSGTFLSILGIGLIVVGAGIFFFGMILMMKIQKEPTRTVYCPYCASKNDLFVSRQEFACDICGRKIRMSPTGEPIPIEPIDDDEDD
ncbi:MAG: hypothetical protein ABFD64_12465 [Armatimonadota bacterium]